METGWSLEEEKRFEKALVMVGDNVPDRWYRIAAQLPGRSAAEVFEHYSALVEDVRQIEAGFVDMPWCDYDEEEDDDDYGGAATSAGKRERRRGKPWTEDEHRRFLKGLEQYGKGDWRNIARNSVRTRNATQVASHAQKYFLRQSSQAKESKRKSIHDIRRP